MSNRFRKLNKAQDFFAQFPKILRERVFLFFLILVFLSLILGGALLYQYKGLIEKTEPGIPERQVHFKEKIYQRILQKWENREKEFNKVETKIYIDPFLETRGEIEDSELLLEPQSETEIKNNQRIKTLFEFYAAKGEDLLFLQERAKIWEEKGLGKVEEYQGFYSQNLKLLEKLRLTE